MTALVTGGAGFIGAHLVRYLLDNGFEKVVALDNNQRCSWMSLADVANDAGVECMQGDIRSLEDVRRAVAGVDVIFHLAAQATVMGAEADVDYAFATNTVGTFNVLRAAKDASVRKVVFASSREVYGEATRLPVSEDAAIAPKNAYGASKAAAEAWCRYFMAKGLGVSVLRLTNIYGPGDMDRVIPIFMENLQRGDPLRIFGGEQVIDFVPVDICCQALLRASQRNFLEPINVGSGQGTTLHEVARHVARECGLDASAIEVVPARDAETKRFVADVTRMREMLGIEPPSAPLRMVSAMVEALAMAR